MILNLFFTFESWISFTKFKMTIKKTITSSFKKITSTIFTNRKVSIYFSVFILFSFLYHNNASYTYFENNINPKIIQLTGKDPLLKLNGILHYFDIIGVVKKMNNPLKKSDFVDLIIPESEQKKLDEYLKSTPILKKKIKIKVKVQNKYFNANLKFHGTHDAHYINNKYSYSINLKTPFISSLNFKKIKLIKGEQLDPTIIAINNIAHSMGLVSAKGRMKILRINNEIKGDYCFIEDIKKELLERDYGITNYSIINLTNNWTRKEGGHSTENDFYVGQIEKNDNPLHAKALFQYKILCDYIQKNDFKGVASMFDKEYISSFLALISVFNDAHFITGDNLKMIYDFDRGFFYPIYRAESLGEPLNEKANCTFKNFNSFLFQKNDLRINEESKTNIIFKILLADNSIREKRDCKLYQIVLQRKKIIQNIQKTYDENERIMYHSGRSRRIYDLNKMKQIQIINSILDRGIDYLKYTHIYGSYDKEKHELHVFFDAFSPIAISYQNKTFESKNNIGIEFDENLKRINKYKIFKIKDANFKVKKLIFINQLTKDTIKKNIHINYINTADEPDLRTTEQMLNDNHIQYTLVGINLIVKPSSYSITSNVFISSKYNTTISAGVVLKIAKKINFIIAGNVNISGTKDKKVIIENLHKDAPFGSFSIRGFNSISKVNISYLNVSGGSESYFMGKIYSSQFSIYNSNIKLFNSNFSNSYGDDGLNIKFSKVEINNCNFYNNLADQIDIDYSVAQISNSLFVSSKKDSNGDGLDLSGSYAEIKNCTFNNFLDKSLSLGEKSKVLVHNCQFKNNLNAITVKDQTKLYSWNNIFENNKYDFSSHIKKFIYTHPDLYINENIKNRMLKLEKKESYHKLTHKQIEFEQKYFMFFKNNFYTSNKKPFF